MPYSLTLYPLVANANGDGLTAHDWSNPTYVTANDSDYASIGSLTQGQISSYLQTYSYGFPDYNEAIYVLQGIEVKVRRLASVLGMGADGILQDYSVKLRDSTGVIGNNKAIATNWTGSYVVQTYGGSSDLWGTSLTLHDIKAALFGVDFSCSDVNGSASTVEPRVEYITITFWYYDISALINYEITTSGGMVCGGIGTPSLHATRAMSGGATAEGTATNNISAFQQGSGGVQVFRATDYTDLATGGTTLEGTATNNIRGVQTMAGGTAMSGSGLPSLGIYKSMTGGTIIDSKYSNGYRYRIKITIPAGKVDSDLTLFPVPIIATLHTTTPTVACTNLAGNTLASEIVNFDSTNLKLHLFVQMDLMSSTSNYLYLYYGV